MIQSNGHTASASPIEPARDQQGSLECVTTDQWQEFVDSRSESTAFHHGRWLKLLQQHYGFPLRIYAWKQAGEVVAGLPFLETRTLFGKKMLISLPFSDNLRALGKDVTSLSGLRQGLQTTNFGRHVCVLNKTDAPLGFCCTPSGLVRHELNLTRSATDIESGYPRSLAQNLRKAYKANLQFKIRNDAEALEIFYRLHIKTRRKHGIPVQSCRFFSRLHQQMIVGGLGFIATASHCGHVVAAGVFLPYQQTLLYKYAASDGAALDLRPNDFLVHHVMKYGVESPMTKLDFGTSREIEIGLRRFKQKWGAIESTIYNDCLTGRIASDQGDSSAMSIARAVIRNSPSIACRAAGKLFYPFSA
ncbi:lipid II:glycine glycyltransferase FemX [Novipirellula artificiosorum]|uniref:FemAB family protein n=1 Tax=Novipirellula artificiosorum TaxID=2528016 RepID=A0A5C6DFD5_9BACT|nr:GNAT family N-acetyltransferase [Novipirellula artificiosorum]TWU34945.1 FemAB family protein [Novipirellula artificiosorum]